MFRWLRTIHTLDCFALHQYILGWSAVDLLISGLSRAIWLVRIYSGVFTGTRGQKKGGIVDMIVSNHNTLSISRPQNVSNMKVLAIHRSIYPIKKPHLITARADINLPLPEQNRQTTLTRLLNAATIQKTRQCAQQPPETPPPAPTPAPNSPSQSASRGLSSAALGGGVKRYVRPRHIYMPI